MGHHRAVQEKQLEGLESAGETKNHSSNVCGGAKEQRTYTELSKKPDQHAKWTGSRLRQRERVEQEEYQEGKEAAVGAGEEDHQSVRTWSKLREG